MRPRGLFGEISQAVLHAAQLGPGTVRELACRAQVGTTAARYTASRLLAAGMLEVEVEGRPAVLRAGAGDGGRDQGGIEVVEAAVRSFWESERPD